MAINVISIGDVFECNEFRHGVKDILIDCKIEGVTEDDCKPWISVYGDGECFNLDIVRNGCDGESYDFTDAQIEDILEKAKKYYLK